MRKTIVLAWILYSLGMVTGESDGRVDRLRFIFIAPVKNESFFDPVKKGMQDAADMLGVECTFTGTEGVDVEAQAAMVRRAVADGYDGIALDIIDPVAFDGVVEEAIDRGVPVVAFNVDDAKTPNARLSAVCQNMYEAGRSLGTAALEFIPPGAKILMTLHDEGISALDERMRGAQDVLKEHGITWKVVVTSNDPARALEVIVREIGADPGIACVLGTGLTDTEAAGKAIDRNFRERKLPSAGFDLSQDILDMIGAGVIRFTIDQQPYVQGFYPVVQLTQYCRYGIMPSDIDAGAAIIAREDVAGVIGLSTLGYR